MESRFNLLSREDIRSLEDNKNDNKSTSNWLKVSQKWLQHSVTQNIEEMHAQCLDNVIVFYFYVSCCRLF